LDPVNGQAVRHEQAAACRGVDPRLREAVRDEMLAMLRDNLGSYAEQARENANRSPVLLRVTDLDRMPKPGEESSQSRLRERRLLARLKPKLDGRSPHRTGRSEGAGNLGS
jgi:hypothetical protein